MKKDLDYIHVFAITVAIVFLVSGAAVTASGNMIGLVVILGASGALFASIHVLTSKEKD